MKILLLSAYDAKSHQRWRKGLVNQFPDFDWTVLTLPARFFSWRIRGNSLSWVYSEKERLSVSYDLIIATSMVDFATLKGLAPHLSHVPSIVYFHENQFAYPSSNQQFSSIEPQMVNLYSALAADQIVFNSSYNQATFLSGVSALLKKLPEKLPKNIVQDLESRSCVIPVPLEQHQFSQEKIPPWHKNQKLNLLWNHRWEYDKGPERLLLCLQKLNNKEIPFNIHLLGESFRNKPEIFSAIKNEFHDRILNFGYIENYDTYQNILRNSDVVLSTSLHDFQGLSILDAVAAGATPLLPNRMAYKDFFNSDYLYNSNIKSPEEEAESLVSKLMAMTLKWTTEGVRYIPDISQLSWDQCKDQYLRIILNTAAHYHKPKTGNSTPNK